ncbi:S9 family peptidase [Halococcus thailandensis]|uniref:Peptidase S9 prolyl oligopeptidase active site domain-containing protein n=1 Tax=Halococcus thailandensis JCM 13552 TaxID=1227457 RepID=M0MUT8_9EURY|nr:prolyl oligopeptidase family serine peptidase [Halococcus thailandensis]EMA48529.1 peptidase S9 prolyl oligopeptidase active site domain-containing protein [Halococcus thailandensis JCM 13552]
MVKEIRPYLGTHKTLSPTVTQNNSMLFLSDISGTMQIWTDDGRSGWPQQQTHYDESISFVEWSPSDHTFIFGKGSNGNEHDQLFLSNKKLNTINNVTEQPDAIHRWGSWTADGGRIAFTSNRRDYSTFDLYTAKVNGIELEDENLLYTGEGGQIIAEAWDPSGKTILVREEYSSFSDGLFCLDMDSQEKTDITFGNDNSQYRQPFFSRDGRSIYCLSNKGSDNKNLIKIDAENGAVETILEGGGWNIDHFSFSQKTNKFIISRNINGYSELSVGVMPDGGEVITSQIGFLQGVVHDLIMGGKGNCAMATISTPKINHSIYKINISGDELDREKLPDTTDMDYRDGIIEDIENEAKHLNRKTFPSSGGVELQRYKSPRLEHYSSFDERKIPAYLTIPEKSDGMSYPAIIDIHGGPHHQRRPWFNPIRQYFVDSGYAVFEPNVRGSSGYGKRYSSLDNKDKRKDSVRDIIEGARWLSERDQIDSSKLVAYGRSYGGFMVLSAITMHPSLWGAAIDCVGISNWITYLERTSEWRRSHRESEYGTISENGDFLRSISPIHDINELACPLFIQHGANDPRVPIQETKQIASAASKQDVPVERIIFEDEGHHMNKLKNRVEFFERVMSFLQSSLYS